MLHRAALSLVCLLASGQLAAAALDQQAKLYSPLRDAPPIMGNPAYPAERHFGSAVSVSGDTAAIFEREPFGHTFLRIYTRDAAHQWHARHEILAPDDLTASMKHGFGEIHALDGQRLAVVAIDGTVDPAVVVFERIDDSWQETARIPTQPYVQLNGSFGQGGVALSGDTLAVGSPGRVEGALGAVHVFVHEDGEWQLQQVVSEADPWPAAGFGSTVRLQGDRLVVTRAGARYSEAASTAVYVFDRSGANWTEQAKVTVPEDGMRGVAYFGASLALDGDRLAIPDQVMMNVDGASYPFDVIRVHERDSEGHWPLVASLETGAVHQGNPSPTLSIAMRGDRIVVGQAYTTPDLYEGVTPQVYLFEHRDDAWSTAQARSPFDWEHGWIDGADTKVRFGAGFGDRLNATGNIAFDDRGTVLVGAGLDAVIVPLRMNSDPPGAVYVLGDSSRLFCDGFEDDDPQPCRTSR